jgi:hypothetical protein
LRFLIDENMPRSLATALAELGHTVANVRDVGLKGHPDTEVLAAAELSDAVIVTRDRGFVDVRNWSPTFRAGVLFDHLPDSTAAPAITAKVVRVVADRGQGSLVGTVTVLELGRALSRPARRA